MTTIVRPEKTSGETSLRALRKSRLRSRADVTASVAASRIDFEALRELRLDRIEADKSRLWKIDLRLSQLTNCLILCLAIPFVIWQEWAFWAAGVSATITVTGMWAFARWMSPREQRLRRHIACLARRRRRCVQCGYRLRDLVDSVCPECGTAFDPRDTRHLLTAETVHRYAARARLVSAVVIVAVLFWVSALAQGQPWPVHVGLALTLLAAFHGLHLFWNWQATVQERRASRGADSAASESPPPLPCCPGCGLTLGGDDDIATEVCSGCGRRLTYGDIFVRPDARRLSDPRITSIQYQSLVLRWVFLLAVCGGLTTVVQFGDVVIRFLPTAGNRTAGLAVLGLPIVLWVVLSTFVFRHLARRLHRRLRLLFALVHPICPRCEADLSRQPVGRRCSECGH